MTTPRVNPSPRLTQCLARSGAFENAPFVLVDVGSSGGIASHWRVFEPHLQAFGFDPLVDECERLNRSEPSPNVRHHAYFVGADEPERSLLPKPESASELWNDDVYGRTSAIHAQRMLAAAQDSSTPRAVLSERRISLDGFFRQNPVDTVDFVKVDTDGHDYEVLLGAGETAEERQALGFFVECQFHGLSHPHSNLFSNIDRLMRERGFSLFDLEAYRYSRAVLPGHFEYDLPGQTHEGQLVWGDALYLRDVTAASYEDRWGTLEPTKLLKLICLHEMFGMPDCAAEVILAYGDRLRDSMDPGSALDLLTHEMDPSAENYESHRAAFQAAPLSLHRGSRSAQPTPTARTRLTTAWRRFTGSPSR